MKNWDRRSVLTGLGRVGASLWLPPSADALGLADDKVETLILSPSAQVSITDRQIRGAESIRVINDGFEASGSDWSYHHQEKRITIARNVRVVLHTRLKDILQ